MPAKLPTEQIQFPDGLSHTIREKQAIRAAHFLMNPNQSGIYTGLEVLQVLYPQQYVAYHLTADEKRKKRILGLIHQPLSRLGEQLECFGYSLFVNTEMENRYMILTKSDAHEQEERQSGYIIGKMKPKQKYRVEHEDTYINIFGERQFELYQLIKASGNNMNVADIDAYFHAKYGAIVDYEARRNAVLRNLANDIFKYGFSLALLENGSYIQIIRSEKAVLLENPTLVPVGDKEREKFLVHFPDGNHAVQTEKTRIWSEYLIHRGEKGANLYEIMENVYPDKYEKLLSRPNNKRRDILLGRILVSAQNVNRELKEIGYCIFTDGEDRDAHYWILPLSQARETALQQRGFILGEKPREPKQTYTIKIGDQEVKIEEKNAYDAYTLLQNSPNGVERSTFVKLFNNYIDPEGIRYKAFSALYPLLRAHGYCIVLLENKFLLVDIQTADQLVTNYHAKKLGEVRHKKRKSLVGITSMGRNMISM